MRHKTKKMRGRKTFGYGSRKKHRSKGSVGGKGMAGTGKRGDAKKSLVLNLYGSAYYGKRGFHPPAQKERREINLDQMQEHLRYLTEKGFAKRDKEIHVDLEKAGYTKLLGRGLIHEAFIIKIAECSAQAREKVEQHGGKILLREKKKVQQSAPSAPAAAKPGKPKK